MNQPADLPPIIRDEAHLQDLLSLPTPAAISAVSQRDGDFIVLGAGGKMGPSLSRMIRRALTELGRRTRVIAVSRFASPASQVAFTDHGIETLRADLLDQQQLDALPDVPNVIYMAGMKFGSTGQEALTWAMNAFLPGMICQKYRHSRIVAFSTGNIYGLSPVARGGSIESDPLNPAGDYAMSCVGRERIFEHFSRTLGVPLSLIRLNYAVEMRYGVLNDLATRVLRGEAIDLAMGHANVIWQGDANAMAIASFSQAATPPFVVNVAGPELLSVRSVATRFGELLSESPVFTGEESTTALLSNGQLAHRLYGRPRVPLERLIQWTAEWVKRGGASLGKPTHFESRDGKF